MTVAESKTASSDALGNDNAELRTLLSATSDVVYRMSPDWREMRQLDGRGFLADAAATIRWWDEYIFPEDQPHIEAKVEEAVRTRTTFQFKHRVRRADGSPGWTFSRAVPVLDASGTITEWFGNAIDITAQHFAEIALRESEERQTFLLKLSDELRPVGDPVAVQEVTTRLLGEALQVDRSYYAEFDWPRDVLHIRHEYVRSGAVSAIGSHPISAFRDLLQFSHEGRPLVCDNVAEHPIFKSEAAAYRARGTDGFILVPLVKQDVMVACLCVTMETPRAWTPTEVELVQDVAERTWAAVERARAEAALRDSEARYRMLFDAIDEGFCLCERLPGEPVDFRYLAVNPAFDQQSGLNHAVGKTVRELVPDIEEATIQAYARVEESGRAEHFVTCGGPLDRWFEVEAIPADRPGRIAILFRNITDRKRTEAALRESEERQRLTVELVPALLWSASADAREITHNEGWSAYTRQIEAAAQDYGWLDAIHPDDLPATRAAFEHAFATGEPLERQQRIHKAGNGYRWHLIRHVPVRNEEGRIVRWFGAAVDIHESKLAEQALDESERRLQTLVEGVPQLVWRAVDGGHWTWASPQWTDYTGQAEADSHDRGWLDPVHPDDRERVCGIWAGAIDRGEFHADYRICHAAEGRYRWFQTRAKPVRNDKGEIVEWLGTSTDVDDLRALQERQQILLAELQHRVRNILAVIRSIVSRSDDGERSTVDYVSHLQGRISALARTQVLLTRRAGGGVDLETMIRDELVAQTADSAQFSLQGPDVELSPKAAEVLTLAIHELATNATKYGAFARAAGRLAVDWEIETRNHQRWLVLDWTESGVPIVDVVPRRQGFGTELVSRRIPYELKGTGSFVLKPGGLQSHMEFPLRAGDSILQTSGVA